MGTFAKLTTLGLRKPHQDVERRQKNIVRTVFGISYLSFFAVALHRPLLQALSWRTARLTRSCLSWLSSDPDVQHQRLNKCGFRVLLANFAVRVLTTHHYFTTMPRTVLGAISGNSRRKSKELTPYERGLILEKLENDSSFAEAVERVKYTELTARVTLYKSEYRINGTNLKAIERSRSYIVRFKRTLVRLTRILLKSIYAQIKEALDTILLHDVLGGILKKYSIKN